MPNNKKVTTDQVERIVNAFATKANERFITKEDIFGSEKDVAIDVSIRPPSFSYNENTKTLESDPGAIFINGVSHPIMTYTYDSQTQTLVSHNILKDGIDSLKALLNTVPEAQNPVTIADEEE